MELLESIIVIVPLWMPLPQIQQNIMDSPLAFQENWYAMVMIVGPIPFTALLYGCGAISLILYFGFIERVHSYRDIVFEVDTVEALSLAESPFDEHAKYVRTDRRRMFVASGTSALKSMSGSMYSSASNLRSTFHTRKNRKGKKERDMVNDIPEDSEHQL
jgi:hypothetical protein